MIRVKRDGVPAPSVLREKGAKERERALAFHEPREGTTRPPREPKFEAYGERDVREALLALFHGKCAYCEGRMDATQPVDVEHWRPKKGVEPWEGPEPARGYYWLAAEWENLLPSCIDCNRVREHEIELLGGVRERRSIGKGIKFPLADPASRALTSTASLAAESPLILNPCNDDPATALELGPEAILWPRPGENGAPHPMGQASIEVYGLNRTALVHARQAVVRSVREHLLMVLELGLLLGDLPDEATRDLVEELIAHELHALWLRTRPDQPYSFAARQEVERRLPELTGEPAFPDPGTGAEPG